MFSYEINNKIFENCNLTHARYCVSHMVEELVRHEITSVNVTSPTKVYCQQFSLKSFCCVHQKTLSASTAIKSVYFEISPAVRYSFRRFYRFRKIVKFCFESSENE